MVVSSTVLRAPNNLASIILPGAPLEGETGEAVPVQVAQLTVGHQPAIGPAWHCCWTCQDTSTPAQLLLRSQPLLRHFVLTAARMARLGREPGVC